jgi:hypothetical protein
MPLIPPMALIISMVARSISAMQSHSMLPCGVRRSWARWPMPNAGWVVIEIRPGSSSRMAFMQRLASVSSVVQLWPAGTTYCRSSSQIGHTAGGLSLGAYWVPQVLQMNAGIASVCHSQAAAAMAGSRLFRPPPMNSTATAADRQSAPDSMNAAM